MLSQLKSWLVAATIVLVTLAPLVWAAPSREIVFTLVVLAIDICGVAAARRYFTGLAGNAASSAAHADTSSKKSRSSAARRRREVEQEPPTEEATWQWLVHAIGMGFGLSAVLAFGYLAYLFEF